MKRRQLITAQVKGKVQHERPCSDCPMARASLPGWLGGSTAKNYAQLAHSDEPVMCQVISNMQCAGMSIYRANVCKRRDPPQIKLPSDTKAVFATPMEFINHHEDKPVTPKPPKKTTLSSAMRRAGFRPSAASLIENDFARWGVKGVRVGSRSYTTHVRPYRLAIGPGANAAQRKDLQIILEAVDDFKTLKSAQAAKGRVREDLRPYVVINDLSKGK